MDTPQEPNGARIIPLFPDTSPRANQRHLSRPDDTGDTSGSASRDTARADMDRLLQEATRNPLPGEYDDLSHVRSVELAMSSGALYPHTATEDIPAAAAARGFRTVELMLQTAGEYDPVFIENLARNAREADVHVYSIHTMATLHHLMSPYHRRAEEGRKLFQQAIDAAAILGARVVVWHGPTKTEVATDAGWERFLAISRELATACGEAGVTLGIENVSRCALSQVRHVANFARELGNLGTREEIGFVFDPFQASEAGANPFMMLAAMGNRVVNVHISDYLENEPSARHLPPGEGDLPWPALIRAIAGSGYSGPLMIEGALGENHETLHRVRQRLEPLIRSIFTFSPDAHRETDIRSGSLPDGVLEGIALFNQREFYEQHEVIEHEWHAEQGPIRQLYQGILQIGVGFHHALNGNWRGAISLLTAGIDKTSGFLPVARGVDTAALVAGAQACLDQIETLGPERIGEFDASRIPVIVLIPDQATPRKR